MTKPEAIPRMNRRQGDEIGLDFVLWAKPLHACFHQFNSYHRAMKSLFSVKLLD
jgi:hypothetical protein